MCNVHSYVFTYRKYNRWPKRRIHWIFSWGMRYVLNHEWQTIRHFAGNTTNFYCPITCLCTQYSYVSIMLYAIETTICALENHFYVVEIVLWLYGVRVDGPCSKLEFCHSIFGRIIDLHIVQAYSLRIVWILRGVLKSAVCSYVRTDTLLLI